MLDPPVVFVTSGLGVAVETVPEAMARVPASSRPPADEWWQYICQWQITAHVLPVVRGVVPYTLSDRIIYLIVDADFWLTEQDRTNNLPPVIQNTFAFGFNSRPRDHAASVRQAVDDYLLRATWQNWSGDQRDMRITVSKQAGDDPRGLLDAVASLDGVPRTLPGTWLGV